MALTYCARLIGCSTFALMMAVAPALAQDQASGVPAVATPAAPQQAAETVDSDEIVVTANKREQLASDVGLSITAKSGDALIERGILAPTDLGKIVPGLTVQPSPFNTPVYTLRGVGFYETTLWASPTVAVYVDEIQLPYSATTCGVAFDIERVEVLKGPQGTLFGQNTTGGAINYIAAKPTDSFAAGGDAGFGRFNTLDLQGFVSGPLGPTLKARLAVRTIQADEWQYSYTRYDKLGKQDQLQGRFLLEWEPSDSVRLLFNANGWTDNSDTQAAQHQSDTCAVTPSAGCGSPAQGRPPAPVS